MKIRSMRMPVLVKFSKTIIIALQIVLLTVTYGLSFLLRFDLTFHELYRNLFLVTLGIVLIVKIPIFYFFGLFRGWWRYVGMSDLFDITKAAACSGPPIWGVIYFGIHHEHWFMGFPRSILLIDMILTIFVIGGARFAVRAYTELVKSESSGANTLIIGAGSAGIMVARELKAKQNAEYNVVGFIDDDASKRGIRIQGIKVLGTCNDLSRSIERLGVTHVLIAIPSATGAQMQQIVSKCRDCRVAFRTLPALSDVINGTVSLQEIREVKVEDLLGRVAIKLDHRKIQAKLENKVVMVTGAGGSIGSELARQVGRFAPKKLILFERSESDLHRMELELQENGKQLNFIPVVGDILDVGRLKQVMADFHPDSIFHAAAYKHVPMMERNCFQAVNNNVFGTYNVALMARQNDVGDFVMISTDKAVNPTSVMGATKRVAELLILGLQNHATRFVSVRFGNVLASNGSVLPRFQEQIAKRQPVTVTHPDMKRYFMTIPEAVELVLEASTLGQGGEIFVLDMGEPVRIADLARNLIQLSGLEPEVDIPIVYTGLRPGEKLFEEIRLGAEGIKPTVHEKIHVFDGGKPSFDQVRGWLDELAVLVDRRNMHGLVTKLKEIVPEYTPSADILSRCEGDRFDRFTGYRRERANLGAG